MKSVAFHNLGCKVNSYEIEVMQQLLQEKGYHIVAFDERADIYIINTCTVTNIADRKSRQMLHRAKSRNPEAVVVAVGCYVQTGGGELLKDGSVDLAVGNNHKHEIVTILEDYLEEREKAASGETVINAGPAASDRKGQNNNFYRQNVTEPTEFTDYEEMRLTNTGEHTRAYIKIQDGCNQFCSYCIIPYARGRVRSRRAEDILAETADLVRAGYREVVLTGIHISSYGIDFDDKAWESGDSVALLCEGNQRRYTGSPKLIDLIEKIHGLKGLDRIRLGSLEPRIITRENAQRMAALPGLCPHFHLSLQSGCNETLKRMNRHYTTGLYSECVEILREEFDEPAITTDVIVGFPGETREEFEETFAFLKKTGFYEMHVFKYSRRLGTPAAKMQDQVPDQEKAVRSDLLLELAHRQSMEFARRYIGRTAEVLFEEKKVINGKEYQLGYTKDYVKIALETDENLSNCLKKIRVTDFLTDEVLNSTSMH